MIYLTQYIINYLFPCTFARTQSLLLKGKLPDFWLWVFGNIADNIFWDCETSSSVILWGNRALYVCPLKVLVLALTLVGLKRLKHYVTEPCREMQHFASPIVQSAVFAFVKNQVFVRKTCTFHRPPSGDRDTVMLWLVVVSCAQMDTMSSMHWALEQGDYHQA